MTAKELEEHIGIPKDLADYLLNKFSTITPTKTNTKRLTGKGIYKS
jgi:hypothetical protein